MPLFYISSSSCYKTVRSTFSKKQQTMKYFLSISVITLMSIVTHAAPSIRYVFQPTTMSGDLELIRLFSDNTFEHLTYSKTLGSGRNVLKNTGTYNLASGKLKLTCAQHAFQSAMYNQLFFVENNKVYQRRWYAKFKNKRYILRTVSKTKFGQPYFIDPIDQKIVRNCVRDEAHFTAFVNYLIQGKTDVKERISTLENYMENHLTFTDATTAEFLPSANPLDLWIQDAPQVRYDQVAVVLERMLNQAGIETHTIEGKVKRGVGSFLSHTWNKIRVGNAYQLHDLASGTEWLNVTPQVMAYSHFPVSTADQLLDQPVTADEFHSSMLVEPGIAGAKLVVDILPQTGVVQTTGAFDILVKNCTSPLSVYVKDSTSQWEKVADPQERKFGGFTQLRVGLTQRFTEVMVKIGSNMRLTYMAVKADDEQEINTEIADYMQSIRKVTSFKIVNPEVNTVVRVKETKRIAPLNLDADFMADLEKYELPVDLKLDVPLILQAMQFYNLHEGVGDKNNADILTFFKETGNKQIRNDETAWCSVFVGYCAKKAGYSYSRKAAARSWLDVGQSTKTPKTGDVVVFWRESPDSWKGHVAIYLGTNKNTNEIICLGGNQDDKVCIKSYCKDQVLDYRRLSREKSN